MTNFPIIEFTLSLYLSLSLSLSQLARRGLNVVLMSRSEQKLNKVAAEISE